MTEDWGTTTKRRAAALAALRAHTEAAVRGVGPAPGTLPDPAWADAADDPVRDAADLLARLTASETLLKAWAQVRESAGDDGAPSRAMRAFERDALENLKTLQGALADGTWRPGPVTRFAEGTGDAQRVFVVSTPADRVVERALSDVVSAQWDHHFSPFSYGYRKGCGVRDAVNALREALSAGWTHVVRADVAAAFDEIPRRRVVEALAARVEDRRVIRLVEMVLERLDPAGLAGVGIAQGSALSPLLLNVYLDPLDAWVLGEGRLPIRFADDLAIPVSSPHEGDELLGGMEHLLGELGLRLNIKKTRVVAVDDGVDYLGQHVRPLGAPDQAADATHPRRVSFFVPGSGGVLRLASGRVRLDRDGQTVAAIALGRVRQIVVGGRIGVTTPLVHAAARSGVDIVLLDEHGQLIGRLNRRRGGDVRIKQAQYRMADDEVASLAIARRLVAEKLANQRVLVLRDLHHRAKHVDGGATRRTAGSLESAVGYAAGAASIASLMGVEGAAARAYFAWWSDSVDCSWAFHGRNRRPPRDPLNAMLSFGYTLLSAELAAACEIAHLDPDLGFLHSPRWGRPALALDLMEPWRPVLVDSVVLGLVRSGHVQPQEFLIHPETGCRMSLKAKRAFLDAYERRMLKAVGSTAAAGRRSFRELLGIYAARFAAALADDQPGGYRGYLWR